MPPKLSGIYILRLENDNYWVSYSSCVNKRIRAYFDGQGSEWAQRHKPVEVVKIIPTDNTKSLRSEVVRMMKKHGWENVRGHPYIHPNISVKPDELKDENELGDELEMNEKLEQTNLF